jgi:hypothetical protein
MGCRRRLRLGGAGRLAGGRGRWRGVLWSAGGSGCGGVGVGSRAAAVESDVAALIAEGLGEDVAAGAVGDKKQILGALRPHRGAL